MAIGLNECAFSSVQLLADALDAADPGTVRNGCSCLQLRFRVIRLIGKTCLKVANILLFLMPRVAQSGAIEDNSSEADTMHIVTHVSGFEVTNRNIQFLHRRLHLALDRLSDSVRRVVVRLSHVNGDRGGIDKRCQLQVQLQGVPDVLIRDVQPDLYLAITRVVDRAARTIARRIGRSRQMALKVQAAQINAPVSNGESSCKTARSPSMEAT